MNRPRHLLEYSLPVDPSRLNDDREHLEILSLSERGKGAAAETLLRDQIGQARANKTASRIG